jgi:hypothetical protein
MSCYASCFVTLWQPLALNYYRLSFIGFILDSNEKRAMLLKLKETCPKVMFIFVPL